mgnify:FL=1
MSQSKKILIYAAIAVVLVAAYLLITMLPKQESAQEQPGEETIHLLDLDAEQISRVYFSNSEGDYALVKSGDEWKVEGKDYMVLEQELVKTLVSDLSRLTMAREIEKGASDLSKYGIAPDGNRIEFTEGDAVHTLLIGDEVKGNGGNYVMLDFSNDVYQYSEFYMSGKLSGVNYYRSSQLFKTNGEDIRTVSVQQNKNGSSTYELQRTNEEGTPSWKIVRPYEREGNSDKINKDIINKIIEIKVEDFVADFPDDLSQYGLDVPWATLTFTDKENQTYSFEFGGTKGEATYFKPAGQNIVYAVSTEKISFLQIPSDDLMTKLLYTENIENIASIRLEIGDKTVALTEKQNGDAVEYYKDDTRITDTEYSSAYTAIMKALSLDGTAAPDQSGTAAGLILIQKKDGSTDNIKLLQMDSRQYLVKVNGEGQFWISKTKIDELLNSI